MPKLHPSPHPLAAALVLLLAGSLTSLDAAADLPVPSPAHSSVGSTLNIDPGGNIAFTVTVRDYSNNLLINSVVLIDLCACPQVVLCPGPQGPQPCQVIGVTGFTGTHTFHVEGGGGCSAASVNVYADGVLLATRRVTSPDQNADLVVDAADLAVLDSKIGGSDLSGDLNGDGAVTISDRVMLGAYIGGTCLEPTPNRRSTWGELKIRYR